MRDSRKLRLVDRYCGVVICSALSMLSKLKPAPRDKQVKTVLAIELFEMGAAMMIYPSLQYIKNNVADATIYCLTLKSIKGSWELLDAIPSENIYAVDDQNLFAFFTSLFGNIWKLRKKNIDLIIDYELFMRVSAIISFMIRSKFRVGFNKYQMEGLYRGSFYDFKCAFNQNSHIAKNFLSLTKTALNFEHEHPNYKGHISAAELSVPVYKADAALSAGLRRKIQALYPGYADNKLILVSPDVGYNLTIRNYPQDMLAEVIRKILDNYPDKLVLLVGTPDNMETCIDVAAKVAHPRCINFCSQAPSLREFFELLHGAELLITNDNGPAHFAGATGTKILALFSTDSPFIYGPLGNCVIMYSFYQCSPCISAFNHKTSKCASNLCLQAIKPQAVYEMAVKVIEGTVPFRTVNGFLRYV
ncbi:MAG: glycosyltransferase family 9 protein [Nitrosomonadales bacterium]|nr:glycosyltransferase family 9 protein [Nitrosomonadales bacterium]